MKVLVLGGTRYVGLRLVHYLKELGHDITILNRGQTKAQLPDGITRLYADRRDSAAVSKALTGMQFEVIYDMTGYEVKNVEPVVNLFAGKIKHYLFISTADVYQESRYLPTREDFPRRNPVTAEKGLAAYGITKVQCEDFLLQKNRELGLPVTICRCPVIYGPQNWMHDREASYFVRLAQGRDILLPGNGSGLLHFTYIDDIVRALVEAVGKKGASGQAFNIASAEGITAEGYVDTIAEIMGVKAKKTYIDFSVMKTLKQPVFNYVWQRNVLLDIHKAKDCYGFWPAISVVEGLTRAYRWWKDNLGISGTCFEPGKLGFNVDLAFEEELASRYRE